MNTHTTYITRHGVKMPLAAFVEPRMQGKTYMVRPIPVLFEAIKAELEAQELVKGENNGWLILQEFETLEAAQAWRAANIEVFGGAA